MANIYKVTLLDADGCEVSSPREEFSLKTAKATAKYLCSAAFATVCETTLENMAGYRAEVTHADGGVVWDCEVRQPKEIT